MVTIVRRVLTLKTARLSMRHHALHAKATICLIMNMEFLMVHHHIVDYALISFRIVKRAARILPSVRHANRDMSLTAMVSANHVINYSRAVRAAAKALQQAFGL